MDMKRMDILTDELRKEILEFLYCDEMYNAILIELIENHPDNLGELYINEDGRLITDILHIKNDGNSNYTSFYYTSQEGLNSIACQIKKLNYDKTLLAGKLEDVNNLLNVLGYKKSVTPNFFYKLNIGNYKNVNIKFDCRIRLAELNYDDIETVRQFTINFLEAETEEEIKSIGDTEKILAKMKTGVYLLEYENRPIGMARFIGETNKYAEITSVYIDKNYRNRRFGKELISYMIEMAIQKRKTPVLETASSNIAAIKTYEGLSFEKQGTYAFEFLD